MAKENTLVFVGSKERLKRNIAKQGGTVADNRFTLVWHSSYFRRGLSFRIRGSYERTESGYLLRYRFPPTLATVLWVSVPVLVCLGFGRSFFLEGDLDAGLSLCLFSALYPAVALWQGVSCHKQLRRFFEIRTQ